MKVLQYPGKDNVRYKGTQMHTMEKSSASVGTQWEQQNVSDCQEEILYLLWQKEERMTSKEILDYFNKYKGKDWKKQTLNTFLLRLKEKGLLQVDRIEKKNYYLPMMTCEEYESIKIQGILDHSFQGSVERLMAALTRGRDLTDKEIGQIVSLVQKGTC